MDNSHSGDEAPDRRRGHVVPSVPFSTPQIAASESLLERLRLALAELAGPSDRRVPAFDEGVNFGSERRHAPGWTSLREVLDRAGHSFRRASLLADEEVRSELQRLIDALASAGAYLLHTDHLDDRELYAYVTEHCLPVSFPHSAEAGSIHVLDLSSGFDDSGVSIFLKHYASARGLRAIERETGLRVEHVDPTQDRDRGLPRPPGFRKRG